MPPLHGQDQAPQTDRFNLPQMPYQEIQPTLDMPAPAPQALDQPTQTPDQQPAPRQEAESTKKGNRKPWIIGGAALAGLGVAASAFFLGTKSSDHDAADTRVGTVATAPAVPGETIYSENDLDKMTGDAFAKVDTATRLSYELPALYRKDLQDFGWGNLKNGITPEQAEFVNNTFPADKSSYSDQQILNQFAIDFIIASSQRNTAEGEKVLSVIMSPDNARFDECVDQIKNSDGVGTLYVLKATGKHATPVIDKEIAGTHVTHGQLIEVHNYGLNRNEYVVFDLLSTKEGQQVWQFIRAYNIDDQAVQKAIQSLR